MREKFPGYAVEVDRQALRLEEVYARAATCAACAKEREATGDGDTLCPRHWDDLLAAEKRMETDE